MATNRKKKPAPSKTRKPGTTYDSSTNLWVYSDNPSTWPSDSQPDCGSGSSYTSSYDSGSGSSYSSDSGSSSSSSSDCGGF